MSDALPMGMASLRLSPHYGNMSRATACTALRDASGTGKYGMAMREPGIESAVATMASMRVHGVVQKRARIEQQEEVVQPHLPDQ